MRVRITDIDFLNRISPIDIFAYLQSMGGSRKCDYRGAGGVWECMGAEFLVPNDRQIADYASSVAAILAELEKLENRSQAEIFKDISLGGYDIVRVKNDSIVVEKGTLPIPEIVKFVTSAKEMVLAAALSVAKKSLTFFGRMPAQTEEYLKTVRFGQTEIGSFVITILSPVGPDLGGGLFPDDDFDPPYHKLVVPKLHGALSAVKEAARKSIETKDMSPFTAERENGVSSNLCDALVGLNETAKDGEIEIGFTLSRNRKDRGRLESIVLDQDYAPILAEASRKMKETQPQPDQEIFGFVVRLHRPTEDSVGQATIQDFMPDKPRFVTVSLSDPEYAIVADAHKKRAPVKTSGTVTRSGRGFTLSHASPIVECWPDEAGAAPEQG